jgi:hypothetical protein
MENATQHFEYIVKVVEKAFKAGAKAERQKFIVMLKEKMKREIPNEKSPSYNGLYAEDKRLYERLIKIIENEKVD